MKASDIAIGGLALLFFIPFLIAFGIVINMFWAYIGFWALEALDLYTIERTLGNVFAGALFIMLLKWTFKGSNYNFGDD